MTELDRRGTGALAELVAGLSVADQDPIVVELATRAIVDSVGVMLAGRSSEAGRPLRSYAATMSARAGGYWVAGFERVALAEGAALINATLAHALDYDDAVPGVGHPSGPVLAACLAAGEMPGGGLSGRRLLGAFVAGFEVSTRVAQALGAKHYYEGWHTTSTAGSFAAAAAAGSVMGLSAEQIRGAFGIVGSMASGLRKNFATMTKPLHSGIAAQRGLLAAGLSAKGFTAATEIFAGKQGLLEVYAGAGPVPGGPGSWDQPLALVQPGTALKAYPCGYAVARPIDAAIQLVRANSLEPGEVARVDIAFPVRGTEPLLDRWPDTGIEGRFSAEYVVAAALTDRAVTLDSFTDSAVARPWVRAMGDRITLVEEPDLRPEDPTGAVSSPATGGSVEVRVQCLDGRLLAHRVEEPYGGPDRPLSWGDIEAKFMDCARFGGYPAPAAKATMERLRELVNVPDVLAALERLSSARPAPGHVKLARPIP